LGTGDECQNYPHQAGDSYASIGSSSGGYRKRIALAAAPLSEPDVLLMDEPTNHLDALSVEWLQSYLNRYRGAILLITHDRYFLIASPTVLSKLTGAIFTPTLVTILTREKAYLKSLPSAASASIKACCAVSWNGSSEVRKPVALNKSAH